MSIHRDVIESHALFREFDKLIDFEGVSRAEVVQLKAMVLEVASQIEPHLNRIQFTFQQYTDHSIQHLLNIATHVHSFLPKDTERAGAVGLNAVELAYLWLAILLHDVGMFVSHADEKQAILDSPEYKDFLRHQQERLAARQAARPVMAQAIDDALFAEFIRRLHAKRVHAYIDKHLKDHLRFREIDLADEVGNLCESHNWGVRESRNSQHHQTVAEMTCEDFVGGTRVNLRYLACCLRLGDILDFDRTRTPLSAFQQIHFTESVSVQEWNKHLSIRGIHVSEHRVLYDAKCATPENYVAVHHFLDWVDRELQSCLTLIREFPPAIADRYALHLSPVVERHKIRMANPKIVAGAFRFQFDYDRIMQLLMDKSLYPDETLFLRELLQNALDACRYQRALAEDMGMGDKYVPRIQVEDHSTAAAEEGGPRIVFRDNGVGISLHQVKNYFMRVGKSFYVSSDFRAERERLAQKDIHLEACSQFGIGFLSCFLGGDRIEVVTYRYGNDPLKITIHGPSKFFVIEQLGKPGVAVPFNSPADPAQDTPPQCSGTQVTVFLRDGWYKNPTEACEDVVYQTLDAVAVNQDVPITIVDHTNRSPRVLAARRWEQDTPRQRWMRLNYKWGGLNHDGAHLMPSVRSLADLEKPLRGVSEIWFLADSGTPVLQKGDLMLSAGQIQEAAFIRTVRWLLAVACRDSLSLRKNLAKALEDLRTNPDDATAIWERLKPDYGIAFTTPTPDPFRALVHEDLEWAIRVAREQLRESHLQKGWGTDREEVEALFTRDRERLARIWTQKGISRGGEYGNAGNYQLALFGIGCPGGFQTWDPSAGKAERHNWIPPGVIVKVDTSGNLAPRPAASRLYVPDERSERVRVAVTRACLRHGRQLWTAHKDSPAWASWYESFLLSWNITALTPLREAPDIQSLVTEFRDVRPKQPNHYFYQLLGEMHSPFGAELFSYNFGITQPIPPERLQLAAEYAELEPSKIASMVDSLSEFLGWDITKGHPPFRDGQAAE